MTMSVGQLTTNSIKYVYERKQGSDRDCDHEH